LTHDAYFKKNGVPELLSPEGFEFAWTQYQTLLVDKLNLLTQGETSDIAAEERKRTNSGQDFLILMEPNS
jgi:superoxide dismutase